MYAIYGNMDPIHIPPINVSIYTSTMDPSWDHNLCLRMSTDIQVIFEGHGSHVFMEESRPGRSV